MNRAYSFNDELARLVGCEKFRHANAESAERHLRELKAKGRENKKRLNTLNVYQCHCGAWHVGHNMFKGKQYARLSA